MDPQWLTALTALLVAAASCALFIIRRLWHVTARVLRFLDDWNGEPAREGLPARPGVMARLRVVEESTAKVLAETRPNDGMSLRDVVHKTAGDVAEIRSEQSRVRENLAALQRGKD